MIENCDGFIKKIYLLRCLDILQRSFLLAVALSLGALSIGRPSCAVVSSCLSKKKSQRRKLFALGLNNWFRQCARSINFISLAVHARLSWKRIKKSLRIDVIGRGWFNFDSTFSGSLMMWNATFEFIAKQCKEPAVIFASAARRRQSNRIRSFSSTASTHVGCRRFSVKID